MIPSLLWEVMQRISVVSDASGRINFLLNSLTLDDGTDRLSQNVG